MDSCFEAQIPQKFEDLWGKSLALKNILGLFGGENHTFKNFKDFQEEKSLARENFFLASHQFQNPTSIPEISNVHFKNYLDLVSPVRLRPFGLPTI